VATVNQPPGQPAAGAVPQITTTGYAILGVLAIKERTAYELAAEMRHCFEYFWRRDDKRVYDDARRLASAGLATAYVRHTGRRPQTTYRITPAGHAALRRWLGQPAAPVALDFQALIKVYLARFGTPDQLRDTISSVAADAEFMLAVATNVRQIYLEGCAPFQDEYVHTWAFVYDFLTSYFTLLRDWADRTRATIDTWADLDPAGKRDQALALFEAKRPAPAEPATSALPGQWQRHAGTRTRPTSRRAARKQPRPAPEAPATPASG
jgi:PadR family transcriptional regulator AphA